MMSKTTTASRSNGKPTAAKPDAAAPAAPFTVGVKLKSTTDIWGAGFAVPREHVKQITGKSYSGDSPRPHWVVQRLTEIFGPCGLGWGNKILSSTIHPPLGEGKTAIHSAHVGLWYVADGVRSELVEAIGATEFSGVRKNGTPYADDDAFKKSVTDGLVKAASLLGVAGEIFMGLYNAKQPHGSKYEAPGDQEERDDNEPPAPPRPDPGKFPPTFHGAKDAAASVGIPYPEFELWWLLNWGSGKSTPPPEKPTEDLYRACIAWARKGGMIDRAADAGAIARGLIGLGVDEACSVQDFIDTWRAGQ